MPASTFQIIFDSRRVASSERAPLNDRLKARLGLEADTLARLFGDRPVAVRRGLDLAQARRFAAGLKTLGAPCRIVAHPSPSPGTVLSDSLVVCPKCQHRQPPAPECHRCGLIFQKYRTERPIPADPAPEPETPAPDSAELRPEPQPEDPPATRVGVAVATLRSVKARLEAPFRGWALKAPQNPAGGLTAPPYLKLALSQALRALLYALIALGLLVAGIWFARGLWGLYTATHVGERYLAEFPRKAQAIVTVLGQHSLVLPATVILSTLLMSTGVATGAQFLHLSRYLYQNRPWWWRLLLWHLPLTAGGGLVLYHIGLAPSARLGAALALLPTLCLAPAAFDLGQALVCELGDLLARLRAMVHLPMVQLRELIASHLDR